MRSCEEIVKAIAARSDRFRLGSCETESMIGVADEFNPPEGRENEWRRAVDYYDHHSFRENGRAYYLEEFDGEMWITVGFGTGGKSFGCQCEEILEQVIKKTYIYSCSTGFRHWSSLPKAESLEELDVKLSVMGI